MMAHKRVCFMAINNELVTFKFCSSPTFAIINYKIRMNSKNFFKIYIATQDFKKKIPSKKTKTILSRYDGTQARMLHGYQQ